jgi:hypothetical protein
MEWPDLVCGANLGDCISGRNGLYLLDLGLLGALERH